MRVSPRVRALLMLVVALATTMALSSPMAAAECYMVFVFECYYDTGGYCYQACPSTSWCSGDVSGSAFCIPRGQECCF